MLACIILKLKTIIYDENRGGRKMFLKYRTIMFSGFCELMKILKKNVIIVVRKIGLHQLLEKFC